MRGVANYLSAQTSFGGARDKFVRLQQISTVLNLDNVSLHSDLSVISESLPFVRWNADTLRQDEDPEEFYSNSGIPWRISKTEYNSLLDQRQ